MSPEIWRRLTLLRGAAALYVVAHHARNGLWWMLSDIQDARGTLFYKVNLGMAFLFWHGMPAVLAFFIISGISIHAVNCKPGYERSPAALPFYRRRALRLYPALIASMALALLVHELTAQGGSAWQLLVDAFGTLTFQQNVLTGNFAGNEPYWSLANEGWYYAAYPLLAAVMIKWGTTRVLLASMVFSTSFLLLRPQPFSILGFHCVWMYGVWIARQTVQRQRPAVAWVLASCIIFTLTLAGSYVGKQHVLLAHPIVSMIGGLACGTLIWWFITAVKVFASRFFAALHHVGEWSYSLYLLHFPVISLIAFIHPNLTRSIPQALLDSLLAMTLSLWLARLSFLYIETPWLNSKPAALSATLSLQSHE